MRKDRPIKNSWPDTDLNTAQDRLAGAIKMLDKAKAAYNKSDKGDSRVLAWGFVAAAMRQCEQAVKDMEQVASGLAPTDLDFED